MTEDLTHRAEELQRRIREVPDDSQARAELATIAARLGDYTAAIDHDARAWHLQPTDPTPIQHILALLVDSGKWLGAMAAFAIVREDARAESAFALDLAATQVLRRITGVFPPRGAHEEADRVVDRVVAGSRARSVVVQISVVRALIDLDRIAEAMVVLEEIQAASAEADERGHICFLRGALCERAGDLAGAIAFYDQALALDVGRVDAAINLISALLESADPAACARIAMVLSSLDPVVREIPEVRFNEAIYLRRIGDQDRAVALLSKIASDRTTTLGRMARQVLASC